MAMRHLLAQHLGCFSDQWASLCRMHYLGSAFWCLDLIEIAINKQGVRWHFVPCIHPSTSMDLKAGCCTPSGSLWLDWKTGYRST